MCLKKEEGEGGEKTIQREFGEEWTLRDLFLHPQHCLV
jgi:hypothetical protein